MLMSFTRDLMDSAGAAEARERVTKWIEQTRQLFSVLPELLVTDTHVNERVSAAEKEVERLRRELEDLKRENHQLRGERDEIAQAMTAVAQRLGFLPRKRPFERTHAGDHTKPGELAKPGEPARPGEGAKPGVPPKRESQKAGGTPEATDHPKGLGRRPDP